MYLQEFTSLFENSVVIDLTKVYAIEERDEHHVNIFTPVKTLAVRMSYAEIMKIMKQIQKVQNGME